MLDVHITEFFDTNEAAKGLSKRLWTSASSIAPNETFVMHKTDMTMEDKKYSITVAPKETGGYFTYV